MWVILLKISYVAVTGAVISVTNFQSEPMSSKNACNAAVEIEVDKMRDEILRIGKPDGQKVILEGTCNQILMETAIV